MDKKSVVNGLRNCVEILSSIRKENVLILSELLFVKEKGMEGLKN